MEIDDIFKSIYESNDLYKSTYQRTKIDGAEAKKIGVESCLVTDIDEVRLVLPSTSEIKVKPSMIWKLLKDIVGKDLSTFSMPVFVNEPTSVSSKGAEFNFYSDIIT